MKSKSTIFCLIIILAISMSLGMVCAGDNTTHPLDLSVEESPLVLENDENEINQEVLTIENEDVEDKEISASDGEKLSPVDENEVLGSVYPVMYPVENATIIVNKIWENNDSGNITEVEVQLLIEKEYINLYYKNVLDVEFSQSNIDGDFNEGIGTSVYLPSNRLTELLDVYYIAYVIVDIVKLTKENNWTYVFNNLTFSPSGLNDYDYVIRESNIQENVEFVSANVSYDYINKTVFWNLTNRIIPNQTNETFENTTSNETVNETENTNETSFDEDEGLEWEKDKDYTDYAMGPEEKNNTTTTSESKKSNLSTDENATGNPLLILLVSMSLIPVLRRKD